MNVSPYFLSLICVLCYTYSPITQRYQTLGWQNWVLQLVNPMWQQGWWAHTVMRLLSMWPQVIEFCSTVLVVWDAMQVFEIIGAWNVVGLLYYTGHLYVKSDVYGFGVVLIEILTGLRALDPNRPSGQHNLTEWVKPYLHERRKLNSIMDARLEGKYPSKAAFRIAQLALKCIASEPKQRPSMKEVLDSLERIQNANEKPADSKFRSTHTRQAHQAVHHRSPRRDASY